MASSARIDELRKKFEENPRRYFAPLANEYRKAGDIEQAIAICREYLPQQPGHMSGHIVYGQALYEARQYEEARTVFETALALDPENLIALRHLGDIALIVGDIDGARGWYGRVLEADPRNEEIQAQLKSLDSVTPAAAPTPMSTPAVVPPAGAAPPAATRLTPAPSEEAVSLPSLELTMPSEATEPARPPASSAPTVVVSAIPTPPVDRTVEIPAPPSPAPVQSLSNTPTAEITLDQVPVPAVPDLDKTAATSRADLPVEKAADFEPTAAAVTSTQPAAPQPAGLEPTAPPPSQPAPVDSFVLEGLETTSMASPPPANEAKPAPAEATAAPSAPAAAPATNAPAPTQPALADFEVASPAVADASSEPESKPATVPSAAAASPTAPSNELTFLDVGEASSSGAERSAEAGREPTPAAAPWSSSPPISEPTADLASRPEPAMAESKPFVTETMAELYEQQGHRDEALRVYHALLEQRPNDDHIRSRIEKLEGKRGPTIRELLARAASRRPAQRSVSTLPSEAQGTPAAESSRAPHEGARMTEAASPAAPALPGGPPAASASEPPTPRSDVLGQLFGSAPVGGADENAAITLSAAFSSDGRANGSGSSPQLGGAPARPASKDLSLDAVFGTESASPPPASSFSFDQFFSERATAEQPAPGSRILSEGQETKDDVAKFTQWLEGLKQR